MLADALGVEKPESAPWHGALFQKLLPQVKEEPFLVVAVAGGTNTGKSVVFNHLVGGAVSRSHPNATQTKHPVCVVPTGFADRHSLADIFPDFDVQSWSDENDPLDEGSDHLLFAREDPTGVQPSRLVLLDTPDIDGTLKANWRRAELVRHAADVLVCILTQQKYNDAAIREFFRAATDADKTVIVVFNMVHWPRQQELCRGWLEHFSRETGVEPADVYAVPWDPDAAEQIELPFYALTPGATSLRADLADLQFDAIKVRSLRGSLRQIVDPHEGLPTFLAAIDRKSAEYVVRSICLITIFDSTIFNCPICRGGWCGMKSGNGSKAGARGSIGSFMGPTTSSALGPHAGGDTIRRPISIAFAAWNWIDCKRRWPRSSTSWSCCATEGMRS